MQDELALVASLVGEPARAAILLSLLGGRALPAGELAEAANVSPQTASGHLAKLVEGKLIAVERQGRHRYYRLGGTEVADAVEALLALTSGTQRAVLGSAASPKIGTMEYARTCYSHLAGWLGVKVADALQAKGWLLPASGKAFVVSESGRQWFESLGIGVPAVNIERQAKFARQCLDWTERRPHVAGLLGIAMYKRFMDLRWLAGIGDTRAARITIEGKREFWKHLQIPLR